MHSKIAKSIFGPIISNKFCKVLWSKIILEVNGLSRRNWISQEEIEMDPKGFIQLSKYHKWDYISSPHLLLGGESVQENQEFFMDWFINS